MIDMTLYSKRRCHLCEDAKELIKKIQKEYPIFLKEIDITDNPKLLRRYRFIIPVIFINGKLEFRARVSERQLRRKLKRAKGNKIKF
ncbi:TPA: glutaredoxin family protein [Candidatus Poribacteria bacterium]|nr:glutaredoxin family protein [Candidatus Poribacteria bacterium]